MYVTNDKTTDSFHLFNEFVVVTCKNQSTESNKNYMHINAMFVKSMNCNRVYVW